MAKWSSTIPEVLHEIGHDSPLGKALASLVENGTAEYLGSNASTDKFELTELVAKLEQLEAMTLVTVTGGLKNFADTSEISYLNAIHEKACECNAMAAKLL